MPVNVLLMEDNYDTAECIRLCLELRKPGAELRSATSFDEAAELLRQYAFDLVILDLGHPDLDGRLILEQVRALTSSPVLILSSLYSPDTLAASMGLALNACIQNPFAPQDFIEKLSSLTHEITPRPEVN